MAERQVRFYEIVNKAKEHFPNDLPFSDLLDSVAELDDETAYVQLSSLEVLGSIYKPSTGTPRPRVEMLVLDRIDRDVRLRIEQKRHYRPLTLADGETLAEPSFFSLFPRNILAVVRNSGNAPGVASLRDYINKLELLSEKVEVIPLADRDALRALQEVETLTKFNFAVGADVAADVFNEAPFIRRAIRVLREELGHVAIEVSVKIAPTGQSAAAEAAQEQVEAVVESDARAFLDKAEMRYRRLEDGRAAAYDFVNEAVAHEGTVDLDPETAKPTVVSVSEGVAEVYAEMFDQIQAARDATE